MGLASVHKGLSGMSYGPEFYRPEVVVETGSLDVSLSATEGLKAEAWAKMSSGQ